MAAQRVSRKKFADWLKLQTCGDREIEKMVTAAADWTDAFLDTSPPRWLAFLGRSGTGKTHTATRLWEWSSKRCDFSHCAYVPHKIYWPAFIQRLRKGDAFDLRDDLKRWPVLFLDDLGADRDPSGFASEELNTLLGCRMNKWTLLTSNLTIDEFSAHERRIASRLVRAPNICVDINTKDFSER